ncbi:MAG: ABC transporter permease [Caldilineales bacterium]|nr:ABC transporter permease [Caldilineales bacterium]
MTSNFRTLALVFQLQLKQMAVDAFVIFAVVVQPLFVALLALYMLRDTDGFQAIYVVVGSAMTGLWSGTLFFSAFNINFERWAGTLESIVASPSSLQLIVSGKSVANTVLALSSMVVAYALAALFFGYQLTISNPPAFVISTLLGVFSLIAFGLLLAPFFSLVIGAGAWVNALEFPMFILGGFLFPLLLLPTWVTPISYALAPYWAARAMHDTSSGNAAMNDVLLSWGMMLVLSLIYLIVSGIFFRRLLVKARVDATLSMQ